MGTQLRLLQRGTAPPPIFSPYPLRPNGCIDQDATWYGARPRPRRLCVRWGPHSPSPKFSAHVYCGQTARWIKMVLGMDVGLSPGDSVLHGDPAPLPQKGAEPPPQLSAHFYCDQTAGCIKMPTGMEVGLSPGDSVLDVYPYTQPPKFSSHVYYSYCDFIIECSSSSSSTLCILFLEKRFNRTHSVPRPINTEANGS